MECQDVRVHALLLKGILQRKRVDNGSQHPHVIGRDAVHIFGLLGHATEKIPAANNDGHLYAKFLDVGNLSSNSVNALSRHTEALLPCQSLAG